MRIIQPSGIGDWSWTFSALYSVRDQIEAWGIVAGWPFRSKEYVQLAHPEVACEYDENFRYDMILAFEQVNGISHRQEPTWKKISALPHEPILLECNKHLEAGKPLATWLPDLPTEYHYPLNISVKDRESAAKKLLRCLAEHPMKDGPTVGISCASYRGAEAWKTWKAEEWVDCLKRMMQMGWRPVLMGGNWDDLTYSVACELDLPDLVGKTSVPEMVEVLRLLDSYVGYSSGMNVIRTVLDEPAFAFWPDFQNELRDSWAPPEMLESRRYVSHLWRPVELVWPVVRAFLRRCEAELEAEPKPNGKDNATVHDPR